MGTGFLPMSQSEVQERGWDGVDFVAVTGDAYVDHPSFGIAVISRVLESYGYRVAILSQPRWDRPVDFTRFGRPRLGFLITSGNLDSMVNAYTVAKRKRDQDLYSPGGKTGRRPDRAAAVYSRLAKKAYPDCPVLLGGLEASLRRLGHYDYWKDQVMPSILLDSGADLLIYGMGETSIVEVAQSLESGIPVREITYVRGTVYQNPVLDREVDYLTLPPFSSASRPTKEGKQDYARSFQTQMANTDPYTAKTLVEPYEDGYIVQNPPAYPLEREALDRIMSLPYERTYPAVYEAEGGVPAISEVRFSIAHNRGCFGGCNFCALTFHQGRIVTSRSRESVVEEARKMTEQPDFKGYIHDVGGPTANFRGPACAKQASRGACAHRQCLFPQACPNLEADHRDYMELLRELRQLPGVKKVFIRSGIRFDYVLADTHSDFLRVLAAHHVSGQLKVAPERVSPRVLYYMGKPDRAVFDRFVQKYGDVNAELGSKQYLVPYFMSSHPGSTLKDAVVLSEYLRDCGLRPEQVQDFYPTPSTASTCMYYTGLDPRDLKPVYVPRSPHEKAMQRALIQYRDPRNYSLVLEALLRTKRWDLIGYGENALIAPPKGQNVRMSFQDPSVQREWERYLEKHPAAMPPRKSSGKKKGRYRHV